MTRSKVEQVFNELKNGPRTVEQLHEIVGLTKANTWLRLKDLKYKGRAYIADWVRKPGSPKYASLWVIGKGANEPKPVPTKQEITARHTENQRTRSAKEAAAVNLTNNDLTIERARKAPHNPFSALGL